jgi:hypothetical protein
MHTPSAAKTLVRQARRHFIAAVRGGVHALTMAVAMFSTGFSPAAAGLGLNEAESAPLEGFASEDAALHFDVRTRLRRPSSQRCDSCTLSHLLPTAASRLTHTSACSLTVTHLSLGLTVPLRC